MPTQFINLTGLTVVIDGLPYHCLTDAIQIKRSTRKVGDLCTLEVTVESDSTVLVNGLPFPSETRGVIYLVQRHVARCLPMRPDVLVPVTEEPDVTKVVSFRSFGSWRDTSVATPRINPHTFGTPGEISLYKEVN